jgi:hypothetical protein
MRSSMSLRPDPADEPGKTRAQPDWYFENGLLVYTAAHHLKRGMCCGSGCRHCPYVPRHAKGSGKVGQEPKGVSR